MPNEFTFPFDTCETPKKGSLVAQPWSTFVNFISLCIVFYFLFKVKSLQGLILMIGLVFFDGFHIFSHFMHIQKGVQIGLVHISAYFINFALLYGLYKFSHKKLTWLIIWLIGLAIALDLYAFLNMGLLSYLFTQLLLFLIILYHYREAILKIMGFYKLIGFLVLVTIIYMAFVNEVYNCKSMLQLSPSFPFHAITEIFILAANYLFVSSFYKI